mgnify:CR=1 FL=1|jgi:hypothetical protein
MKSKRVPLEIVLEYLTIEEKPEAGTYGNCPADPPFTDELEIGVYIDDDSIGPPTELVGKPLQVRFAGTPRALEAFGKYLIALARLETANPSPHDHFENVKNEYGGTVHLITERLPAPKE